MQIRIFYIQKDDEFGVLREKYLRLISRYAVLRENNLLNKKISKAQNLGALEARKSYEEAFLPYKKDFCIVLDERGEQLTSVEFARLIENKKVLNFFIGGAFGLGEEFLRAFDFRLSLSRLTLAHQFAKILLLEQIYRAFCIHNNHPYHKLGKY